MRQLSILSWNVEHFNGRGGTDKENKKKRQNRVRDVINFVKGTGVDVFGLSEVEGTDVHERITRAFPGYTFHLTEGLQSQEILIGARRGLTTFFTQRNEFKRNNPYLRPGALLTVTQDRVHIPILFVHLKSLPSPEGFGLRDAMFDKIFHLKRKLDEKARERGDSAANFIVVGDMNTMGMDYDGKEFDIPGDAEINQVVSDFKRRGMNPLKKSHPYTFNNGSKSKYKPSALDHVFAAKHLRFNTDKNSAEVAVGGWAQLAAPAAQDRWIGKYSDHAPLTFVLNMGPAGASRTAASPARARS